MTRAYTHDELRDLLPGIECAARSGLSLGPETSLRLVATVRDLQRELRQQASRIADDREAGYLPAPGTVEALVTSAVPDDPAAVGRGR